MLAQAQECVWQWAVMGMINGFGPYRTTMTFHVQVAARMGP